MKTDTWITNSSYYGCMQMRCKWDNNHCIDPIASLGWFQKKRILYLKAQLYNSYWQTILNPILSLKKLVNPQIMECNMIGLMTINVSSSQSFFFLSSYLSNFLHFYSFFFLLCFCLVLSFFHYFKFLSFLCFSFRVFFSFLLLFLLLFCYDFLPIFFISSFFFVSPLFVLSILLP